MSAKHFRRGPEPSELQQFRRTVPAEAATEWAALDHETKEAIRAALLAAQSGLCCYCYGRLTGAQSNPIEHITPQATREGVFAWDNLALSCDGGNAGGRPSHCDHSKGSTPLSHLHPFDRPSDTCARVMSSGKLRPVSPAEDDVEEVLQLNRRHLQQSRRAAIEAEIRDLEAGSRRGGRWRARRLERALSELERRTRPHSMQPWTEQWLERQLRSR